MNLELAREKLSELRPPATLRGLRTQGQAHAEGSDGGEVDQRPTFGLGLAPGSGPGDYKIAIRIQDAQLEGSSQIEALAEAAGEVDIRTIGLAQVEVSDAGQQPAFAGVSTSLDSPTAGAGTLGCFVEQNFSLYALSNSHVVADFGRAPQGSAVIQPARGDGGRTVDRVGELADTVPVDVKAINSVDCAIVALDREDVDTAIQGLGQPTSQIEDPDFNLKVKKSGRTTGLTEGRISALDMNLLVNGWPGGPARFVDLIEISGTNPAVPFSEAGDSGSLVVDSNMNPVALIIAGAATRDGKVTYATPISQVLSALGAKFP